MMCQHQLQGFRKMMSPEEIRAALQDRNLARVSEGCGLSRFTLLKFKNGQVVAPSYDTVKAISDYLEGKPAGKK
jgi:hypothetical protein